VQFVNYIFGLNILGGGLLPSSSNSNPKAPIITKSQFSDSTFILNQFSGFSKYQEQSFLVGDGRTWVCTGKFTPEIILLMNFVLGDKRRSSLLFLERIFELSYCKYIVVREKSQLKYSNSGLPR
jgi:hypothetical protein